MNWTEDPNPEDHAHDAVAAWINPDGGEVVILRKKGEMRYEVEHRKTEKKIRSHKDNALAGARRFINEL